MTYGFRISKPGINVFSSAPKDRVIDAEIPCLKLLQVGKQEFVRPHNTSFTYEHSISTSLPFMVFVYVYQPTLQRYKPATPDQWSNYFNDYLFVAYEFTATTLYITINNQTGGSIDSHYYWYIGYA